LLLLIVLTHALAPLAPILLLLIVPTRVLAPPAPLLLLLIVLTHVLTQLGLCVHCIVAHFLMIAPNSSLQDWHAFPFDKEPFLYSSLVYNQNEDSFNQINSQSDVRMVRSTNECVKITHNKCVGIIKKYLYCIYVIT
jgi:hypothetical protein